MSIVVNHWRMDSSLNALIHCETGETRRLGEYHFILLETLAKNADTVLSRSFLMTEVWKNRIVGGNSLPTAIHALRVAIDDDGKQQEIIKTIPKKGYLFNKNYLTEIIDLNINVVEIPSHDEALVNPEDEATDDIISINKTNDKNIQNQSITGMIEEKNNKVVGSKQHTYRAALITLSVVVTTLFLLAMIFYFKVPSMTKTEETPQLVKESLENANRITVFHLYDAGENNKKSSPISQHILPGVQQVNQLLQTYDATMTMYYRVSLNKFSLDMVLSNQCNDQWQLALSFDDWLNKDNEMNGILIKEVEKMLNEIPKCK
ncbi:transcriptional regulator [Citrobacter sp. Res13-Sevr-PEB04-36]|uniref:transcriptional regulator n=1 Tax=Citrobacter sp. Res13-Sevr-PEB04-36 TaxID=2777960 RepID=UPI0018ACD22F|nr:winged helix-turn-helix domain-containing protein [Citrobacter sp. Res13-Sevr-PEB04-36]